MNLVTIDEKNLEEEVMLLRKRIEKLEAMGLGHIEISGSKGNIDTSKFLEKHIFNEFKKVYDNEVHLIWEAIKELRKLIDDILNMLKKYATKEELQALEGMLIP